MSKAVTAVIDTLAVLVSIVRRRRIEWHIFRLTFSNASPFSDTKAKSGTFTSQVPHSGSPAPDQKTSRSTVLRISSLPLTSLPRYERTAQTVASGSG